MRSATSFFDKTTARSDLRRHWPIAFIYTCVWLVGLPVNLWSSSMWMPEEMTPALRAAQIIIGSYPTLAGALFVFGCVLAMALMGYLMSPRAVGLLHALPVRRGTLLATHTLVGWLMLNVPALLAVLVSIPVQAYYGGVAWGALGAWLLVHCGLSLFFLALGLLCAMVTGWLLAIPAIYAVVNFAVIAAAGLVRTLCGLFCYGYAGDDDFAPFVYWLTPVVNLVKRFGTCGVERSDAAPYPWQVQFPADAVYAVGIYTAAGAALLALTYLLYRRRKSESAADPAAFPWMRPVFRYGTGLLGGLALGLGLYQLVLGWRMAYGERDGPLGRPACEHGAHGRAVLLRRRDARAQVAAGAAAQPAGGGARVRAARARVRRREVRRARLCRARAGRVGCDTGAAARQSGPQCGQLHRAGDD